MERWRFHGDTERDSSRLEISIESLTPRESGDDFLLRPDQFHDYHHDDGDDFDHYDGDDDD